MLYLYKNKTPNIDNNLFYYFTDFQAYLTELGTPYLSIDKNSYQINNNVVTAKTDSLNVDVDAITYVIDYDTTYYRCYHVNNANIVSGYLYFDVAVDYWGSFIAKCSLENIVVNRCNRNIGNGVFDAIEQTNEMSVENYYKLFDRNNLVIAYLVCIKTSSGIFSDATTSLQFFGNYVESLTNVGSLNYAIINHALDLISGVTKIHYGNNNYTASVLKAFILPKELVKFKAGGTYTFDTTTIDGSSSFSSDGILLAENSQIDFSNDTLHQYEINIDANYKYYLGTKETGVEIPRTTNGIYPIIKCNVSQDNIEVYAGFGDNFVNISNAFSVTITTNNSNMTQQEKITKGIATISSVISGVAQMSMGGLGWLTGGTTISNAITGLMPQKSNGSYINGGDGITTFFDFQVGLITTDSPKIPFKIVKYKSIIDEKEKANRIGANFNIKIADIPSIFNSSMLGTGSNNTYIQADAIVKNVCIDAMQTIKNALRSGIYVKHLSIS